MKEIKKFIEIEQKGETILKLNPDYKEYMEDKKYRIRLKNSGIPKNYWDIEFDDYIGENSRNSLDKAIIYSERCLEEKFHNVNLFLTSSTNGTQKSMVACNIGKEFIKNNLTVKFVYASELIDILLKSQGYGSNKQISYNGEMIEPEYILNNLYSVDLLIIDDIFDKKKSTYWKSSPELAITSWDKFLRKRISEDKRMVLTSNFNMDSIEVDFGTSLYNLLHRNFVELNFYDSVVEKRIKRFDNLWD